MIYIQTSSQHLLSFFLVARDANTTCYKNFGKLLFLKFHAYVDFSQCSASYNIPRICFNSKIGITISTSFSQKISILPQLHMKFLHLNKSSYYSNIKSEFSLQSYMQLLIYIYIYILINGQNCLMPFSPKLYSFMPLFPN